MDSNSVNKVILVGHLGHDPEVKYTPNDTITSQFSIATNKRWKDKDGEYKDRTSWHRIVCWRNLAEYSKTLLKGQQIYLEGHLITRDWTDKEKNKHYITEIVAEQITPLGARKKADKKTTEKDEEPF